MNSDCDKAVALVSKYDGNRDSLVSILQDIQAEYHYLPEDVLKVVARQLGLQLIQVYGVATFFKAFSLKPRGKHIVSVCLGTACHVRGGAKILEETEKQLGIKAGETTEDLEWTLETIACFGSCALAPVMVIDKDVHGRMTANRVKGILAGSE